MFWLFAFSSVLANAQDATYVAPEASAELRITLEDYRSLDEDAAQIRAALNGLAPALSACQRDGAWRHHETRPMALAWTVSQKGQAKRYQQLAGSGLADLDACVAGLFSTIEARPRFRTPIRVDLVLPPPPVEDDQPVPRWDRVHAYTLPNGLEVLHLPKTGEDAQVFLHVGVGTLDEEEGTRGVTHLVQHLLLADTGGAAECLSPSACAPPTVWRSASGGVRPESGGVIQHGGGTWTSPVRTVLDVPGAEHEVTPEQLDRVRRWFDPEPFDAAVIEQERQEVLAETRQRLGPERAPLPYAAGEDPRWAANLGSDVLDDLSTLSAQAVERHRHRFFRPDNAVLVIVGGTDAAQTEALVRSSLGPVERPDEALPARDVSFRWVDGDKVRVRPKHGAPVTLRLRFALANAGTRDHTFLRTHHRDPFLMALVLHRLRQRASTVGLRAGTWHVSWLGSEAMLYQLSLTHRGNQTPVAFAAAVHAELRRMVDDGFSEEEVDAVRLAFQERDGEIQRLRTRMSSDDPGRTLLRVAAFGDMIPPPGYRSQAERAWAEGLDGPGLARRLGEVLESGVLTELTVPPERVPVPDEAELLARVVEARTGPTEVPAPAITTSDLPALLASSPGAAPRVVARSSMEGTLFGTLTLDNGARVYRIPGPFHGNELRVRLVGESVSAADARGTLDARAARAWVLSAEHAGMDVSLHDWLLTRGIALDAHFDGRDSSITLHGPPSQLPTMVAALRALLGEEASADPGRITDLVGSELRAQLQSPEQRVTGAMAALLGAGAAPVDLAPADVEPERAGQLVRRAFADPAALQLVLSGTVPDARQREQQVVSLFNGWTAPSGVSPADASSVRPPRPPTRLPLPPRTAQDRVDRGHAGRGAYGITVLRSPGGDEGDRAWLEGMVSAVLLEEHLTRAAIAAGGELSTARIDAERAVSADGTGEVHLRIRFASEATQLERSLEVVEGALDSLPAFIEAASDEELEVALRVARRRIADADAWFSRAERQIAAGAPWRPAREELAEFDALELDRERLVEAARRRVTSAIPVRALVTPPAARDR